LYLAGSAAGNKLRGMKGVLLALVLFLPAMVAAQSSELDPTLITKSGTLYLQYCEAPAGGVAGSMTRTCNAWLDGVVRGIVIVGYWSNKPLIKLPDDAQEGQIKQIVVKYMRDHPRDVNDSTSLLVLKALMDAYPPQRVEPAKKANPTPKKP
jgi:hypothetical protein